MNFLAVFFSFLLGTMMGTMTAGSLSLWTMIDLALVGACIGVVACELLPDNRAGGCIRRGGAKKEGADLPKMYQCSNCGQNGIIEISPGGAFCSECGGRHLGYGLWACKHYVPRYTKCPECEEERRLISEKVKSRTL